MVGWVWWDWELWMTNRPLSALWHCWLGHQTFKNISIFDIMKCPVERCECCPEWGVGVQRLRESTVRPSVCHTSLCHATDSELLVCMFAGSSTQRVCAVSSHVGSSLLWSRCVRLLLRIYTVGHKKRATLFWTITSTFLGGFEHFVYQRKKE